MLKKKKTSQLLFKEFKIKRGYAGLDPGPWSLVFGLNINGEKTLHYYLLQKVKLKRLIAGLVPGPWSLVWT